LLSILNDDNNDDDDEEEEEEEEDAAPAPAGRPEDDLAGTANESGGINLYESSSTRVVAEFIAYEDEDEEEEEGLVDSAFVDNRRSGPS